MRTLNIFSFSVNILLTFLIRMIVHNWERKTYLIFLSNSISSKHKPCKRILVQSLDLIFILSLNLSIYFTNILAKLRSLFPGFSKNFQKTQKINAKSIGTNKAQNFALHKFFLGYYHLKCAIILMSQ